MISTIGLNSIKETFGVIALKIKRKWVIAIVLVAAVGAAAIVYTNRAPEATKTLVVKTQAFQQKISAIGRIEADRRIDLKAEVSGTLIDALALEGETVTLDQVVAKIDNQALARSIQENQTSVQIASARLRTVSEVTLPQALEEINQLQTNYDQQRKILADTEVLYESGALSKEALDNAALDLSLLESRLNAAKSRANGLKSGGSQVAEASAGVTQARTKLETLKQEQDKYQIKAPFNAIVLEQHVLPGEYVQTGQLLLTLVDESGYHTEVDLEESKIGLIQVGQAAKIWPESYPSKAIEGHVAAIAPKVDPATGTVRIRLDLDSKADFLIQNLTVQVEIVVRTMDNALILPAEWLWAKATSEVLVVIDGKVESRKLTLETVGLTDYLVIDGLTSGEIVLDPSSGYNPGDSSKNILGTKEGETP